LLAPVGASRMAARWPRTAIGARRFRVGGAATWARAARAARTPVGALRTSLGALMTTIDQAPTWLGAAPIASCAASGSDLLAEAGNCACQPPNSWECRTDARVSCVTRPTVHLDNPFCPPGRAPSSSPTAGAVTLDDHHRPRGRRSPTPSTVPLVQPDDGSRPIQGRCPSNARTVSFHGKGFLPTQQGPSSFRPGPAGVQSKD